VWKQERKVASTVYGTISIGSNYRMIYLTAFTAKEERQRWKSNQEEQGLRHHLEWNSQGIQEKNEIQ